MLFINKGNPSSILIRIGEHCATNCYNCYSRYDNYLVYNYVDFFDVFNFIDKKCDNSFSIFLFGMESIFHPDIEKFINNNILKKFRISLHINPIFSYKRINKILELSNKYVDINFETCYTLKRKEDFIGVFKTIKYLKSNNIKSSMDLFLDFEKYGDIIKHFFRDNSFKYRKQLETSHLNFPECLEFTANDKKIAIMIYHTKRQEIRDKKITNIPNTGCVVRKTFNIKDDNILVNEEIELDFKGVIKMHINTYCNKAIKKISSIYRTNLEIKNDFLKLDSHLKQYDNNDMGSDCFRCVSNPYINN